MYNPIRRNRNIGTAKQGHGQNNTFCIPWPFVVCQNFKDFYERIENYRKETILSPVWGRMIFDYEFENQTGPTIILEAFRVNDRLKWSKKLSVDSQKELERLRQDGHEFAADRRSNVALLEKTAVRNTQLYRTLLHEIGHYVHYLQKTGRFSGSISKSERESFAHAYAERQHSALAAQNLVPFEQSVANEDHDIG